MIKNKGIEEQQKYEILITRSFLMSSDSEQHNCLIQKGSKWRKYMSQAYLLSLEEEQWYRQ